MKKKAATKKQTSKKRVEDFEPTKMTFAIAAFAVVSLTLFACIAML